MIDELDLFCIHLTSEFTIDEKSGMQCFDVILQTLLFGFFCFGEVYCNRDPCG